MNTDAAISQARQSVFTWLIKATGSPIDYRLTEENRQLEDDDALTGLFFEKAKSKGFYWCEIHCAAGCMVRWSHLRCRAGSIVTPDPVLRIEHARLLACAALLRHEECYTFLSH